LVESFSEPWLGDVVTEDDTGDGVASSKEFDEELNSDRDGLNGGGSRLHW
jgi:hypothetical protein